MFNAKDCFYKALYINIFQTKVCSDSCLLPEDIDSFHCQDQDC